jgi:hypothetical protein
MAAEVGNDGEDPRLSVSSGAVLPSVSAGQPNLIAGAESKPSIPSAE